MLLILLTMFNNNIVVSNAAIWTYNIFTMPSSGNTMFSMSYNMVYNISCFPSPAPGQALVGFHKNGPKRADVSLYVLPDRPGVKRAAKHAARAARHRH